MKQWVKYFIGTPKKFIRTAVTVAVVTMVIMIIADPGLAQQKTALIINEILRIMIALLPLALMYYALRWLLRGGR